MAVLYMEMSFRGGEPETEMWEGPDEELLLETMIWASGGVDGKVRFLDCDGNEVLR